MKAAAVIKQQKNKKDADNKRNKALIKSREK
jgi:hypothetical protein